MPGVPDEPPQDRPDALARVVDELGIDVWCFGLSTDFRSQLFPGARRLFELADELVAIQVEVLCRCGRPGRQNSRVVDGVVQRTGDLGPADGRGQLEMDLPS